MIRDGNRIMLTVREREQLADLVGERCNPQTVTEYNAWLERVLQECDDASPEERLLAAVLADMKLPE